MGDGICEKDDQVGGTDLVAEIRRQLCKYLALAAVVFADVLIAAVHPVMSADNYNTHGESSFYWLAEANTLIKKYMMICIPFMVSIS